MIRESPAPPLTALRFSILTLIMPLEIRTFDSLAFVFGFVENETKFRGPIELTPEIVRMLPISC